MQDEKTRVRFLGGPYDGLEFSTTCRSQNLATVAELPICQDVLWALSGRLRHRHVQVRAVAVYAAVARNSQASYEFVKQRDVRSEEVPALDSWCHYVILSEASRHDDADSTDAG